MTKKYTTRTHRLISYFWISIPLTYLIFATLGLGLPGAGLMKLVLSPWYWFVSALAVVAGNGILRIRWFGWYTFLFSNFTLTYQTAVALVYYSEGQFKIATFAATLVMQLAFIYLVGKEIRVPYYFPRIRWWESDPRYKLSVPTKILREEKVEFEGEIMDLSLGGCFIKTHGYFTPDERVSLNFSLFERDVVCVGHVIWRTESTVTHPRGIGVKFDPLNRDTSFCLKQATKKLRKLARVYSQMSRERNWQEYLQREQKYQGKTKNQK